MTTIREMRPDERDAVLELLTDSRAREYPDGRGVFAFDPADLYEALYGADRTFVATDGERIIGTVSLTRMREDLYSVGSLVVVPEERRHGVGSELLNAARLEAGDTALAVALPRTHESAMATFDKAGFKVVGVVMEHA